MQKKLCKNDPGLSYNPDLEAPPIPDDILREVEKRVAENAKMRRAKIVQKAEDEAQRIFIRQMYLRSYSQSVGDGDVPFPVDCPQALDVVSKQTERLNTKPPFCLLTVNPRPEVKLADFKKKLLKFLGKKTVPEYFACIEVRKNEDGMHAHILCRYTPPPSQFKRSTKNTFRDVCDSDNSCILNFKFLQEDLLPDKIKYMLGEKQQKKQKGVEDTKLFRKKYDLPDYWESNPPLSCRVTQITTPVIEEI